MDDDVPETTSIDASLCGVFVRPAFIICLCTSSVCVHEHPFLSFRTAQSTLVAFCRRRTVCSVVLCAWLSPPQSSSVHRVLNRLSLPFARIAGGAHQWRHWKGCVWRRRWCKRAQSMAWCRPRSALFIIITLVVICYMYGVWIWINCMTRLCETVVPIKRVWKSISRLPMWNMTRNNLWF